MAGRSIVEKYRQRVAAVDSLVCVGLDPEMSKVPERFLAEEYPQFAFNRWVIEQTAEFVVAFKPNAAFYEARGAAGIAELQMTAEFLARSYPDVVTVCDAKRADIGNTNQGYATSIFDLMKFDAITLHPYLGREALSPFLEREDKANIILCRTSNSGAGEFQDLDVGGKPVWQIVAEKVSSEWNGKGNCMLVVGATYPEEMRVIRAVAPELIFLVPGVGAQGGDVRAVVAAGVDARGEGLMISSSRAVIFSDDPGAAARALRDEINAARKVVHAAR